MKLFKLTFCLLLCTHCSLYAQDGFQNLSITLNGKFYDVKYKFHHKNTKGKQILRRDFVVFHLETRTEKDSVLRSTFKDDPYVKEISVEDYKYLDKGFLEDFLLMMHVGDSATFLVKSDYLFEAINRKRPPFIKPGTHIKYIIKVLKTQNEQETQKDENEIVFKQKKIDDKLIAQYVAKHLPQAKRTYSGIWYHIESQGEGDFAFVDDVVSIAYTGKFLDGKIFGSSEEDGRLFQFPVGGSFAIKAFDELMLLLKKGAKGTFIIPSPLAYGEQGFGERVPPNTVIMFDIEFMDIVSRKIIIENKGKNAVAEEEKKEKTISRDEYLQQVEKDAKKKGLTPK